MNMTSLTPPKLAQAPLNPKPEWITPEEQLDCLARPIAKALVDKNQNRFVGLADCQLNTATECAIRSLLQRSHLPLENSGPQKRIATLMQLGVESILEPSPLPPCLTTWYKALKPIKKLPEKIPPLPPHIHDILNKECPRLICSAMKEDNTFPPLVEHGTLTLVPKELQSINEFEKILKLYGEEQNPQDDNPLQFKAFLEKDYLEEDRLLYRNTQFGPTYWQFHTDSILETSANQFYHTHDALVDRLATETHLNWQIPDLRDTVAAIFLRKIGSGESLFQAANAENGQVYTYTFVKERLINNESRLAIGEFSPDGLCVHYDYNSIGPRRNEKNLGIAARVKF